MRKKLTLLVIVILSVTLFVTNKEKMMYKFNRETNGKTYKMYLENDSGEYELSNSKNFPTDGYTLDTSKSSCSNGSKVSQNQDKSIKVTLGSSDECSLYFKKTINTMNKYLTELKAISSTSVQNGIYYFDDGGNLDYGDDKTKIDVNDKISNVQGLVSIWNKQLIYACIKDKDTSENGYSWYYGDSSITSSKYPCQTKRYENLVTNGDLSSKSNLNFTNMGTYEDDGLLVNSYDYMSCKTDELIPIDPNKKYQVSFDIKTNDSNAFYYVGIVDLDINKNDISLGTSLYVYGTDTMLTQDLNNGDTEVHVKSLENWIDSNLEDKRSIIFWDNSNPVDGTFKIHTHGNYYRNIYDDDSSIDKTNNIIKLREAWNGGTHVKGTNLSQGNNGNTYNYSVLSGSSIQEINVYKNFSSGVITGYDQSDDNHFRYGTHFIRFLNIANYKKIPNVKTYIRNVVIREIK